MQIRRQRPREGKTLAEGHTGGDSIMKPLLFAPRVTAVTCTGGLSVAQREGTERRRGSALSSNPEGIASCQQTSSRLPPASTLCPHVRVCARARAEQDRFFLFPCRFATGQLRAGLQTRPGHHAEPRATPGRTARYLPPAHPDCHSAGTPVSPVLASRARPAFCKATATTKPSALQRS